MLRSLTAAHAALALAQAAVLLAGAPGAARADAPPAARYEAPPATGAPSHDTAPHPGTAQGGAAGPPRAAATGYSSDELIDAGHAFFGEAAAGIATVISDLLSRFGRPEGYILGEEASGAFFGGLRYGEGSLHLAGTRPQPVFWQGPSVGWDFGGSGSRVMMLVYDLPSADALMQRFTGVDGSAYFVGGMSVTVMAADTSYVIPVRTGVGLRLGASLGYLKFTPQPTWNPF